MFFATILLCLANTTTCQSMTVKVERAACLTKPFKGQAPINGQWKDVVIAIHCDNWRHY